MSEERKFDGEQDSSRRDNVKQYGKKGRKPRQFTERREVDLDSIRTNAIEYWNKSEGYNNATKLAWSSILGVPYDANNLLTSPDFEGNIFEESYLPPSIMKISFLPGPGWAEGSEDGVNRALAEIMTHIRSSLSTSNIGFSSADLATINITLSSISTLIAYAKKVLECAFTFKYGEKNFFYPRGLTHAHGLDWADIRDNINQYVAMLNAEIARYNKIGMLDIFDVFDRQYGLTHNIFADEDTEYAQLYTFIPSGYYLYNDQPEVDENGFIHSAIYTKFVYSDFPSIVTIIRQALDRWYNSTNLYQILGCINRAYKDAPKQMIPLFDMGTTTEPVLDREHLMQIMNMTIMGENVVSGCDIIENPNTQTWVYWNPYIPDSYTGNLYVALAKNQLLRVYESDVNQDDNMEMTRLMNFATRYSVPAAPGTTGRGAHYYLKGAGTEIVTGMQILTYDAVHQAWTQVYYPSNYIRFDDADPEANIEKILKLQAFRYIPCIHVVDVSTKTYMGVLGDIYNWYPYAKDDWMNLQYQALISVWKPKNV